MIDTVLIPLLSLMVKEENFAISDSVVSFMVKMEINLGQSPTCWRIGVIHDSVMSGMVKVKSKSNSTQRVSPLSLSDIYSLV